jgi:hypothetical protein
MAGAFPALVREIPELRDSLLTRRIFLGPPRVALYGAALAVVIGWRRSALALAGVWAVQHYRRLVRSLDSHRALRLLPLSLALDVVTAGALVSGSVRTRTPVL